MMKTKIMRFLKLILPCFLIIVGSLIVYTVSANEKLTIVDFKYYDGHPSNGLLYSDNRLLLWGEYVLWGESSDTRVFENIKDFELLYGGDLAYLTYDNKFYDSGEMHENIVAYAFSGDGVNGDVAYKDTDDNLYVRDRGSNYHSFFTSSEEKIIATDVKDFILVDHWSKATLLYTTNDNTLHALGVNYFGTKINEGNDFTEIYDLLDNVKTFTEDYAITNDGELYYFNEALVKPTVIYENVEEVVLINEQTVLTNYEKEVNLYYIEKTDGTYTCFWTTHDYDNGLIIDSGEIVLDFIPKQTLYSYVLGENGNLYQMDVDNTSYDVIDTNIKEISASSNDGYYIYEPVFYALTNDNDLYYNIIQEEGAPGNELARALLHNEWFYGKNKLLSNVESIKYLRYDIILLTDGSILRFGSNDSDAFNNPDLPTSYIPVKINDLINDNREIESLEVVLGDTGITNFTVGEEIDYYSTVVPYNSTDRETVWSSSNEEVVTVDQDGLVKTIGVGTAEICTTLKSDNNMKDCTTVNVYPKVSSVEITNGESLDVELYEKVLLTAKVNPEDTLEKEVIWSVDSDNIYLSQYDYDSETYLPNNQIYAKVYAGGSYKVKVTTKNGLYSDTITINTVEKVSDIELDIGYDNFDGINNAFIYLSESNILDVGYRIYPTTATNQNVTWESHNPEIATVDSTGKITAYQTGRARITIKSVDGGAERTFNVLVYDYSSENIVIGDVTGDGVVNVLDLIRMRNYLAGLEDSLS